MRLFDATHSQISLSEIEDVTYAYFETKGLAIAVGAIYTAETGYDCWPPEAGKWRYSFDSGEWEEEK